MQPNEALQVVDNAVSQLQTTRQVHAQIQQAIMVLKKAIQPIKDEVNEPPKAKIEQNGK